MRPSRSQPFEDLSRATSDSPRGRPSVFLFVACPQEVLTSFERAVRAIGAIEQVEPIAVSVYPSGDYLRAFLAENHEDVSCVTIDLAEPEEAMDLIEIVKAVAPNALILATDDGSRAESLLPALRTGAKDVIAPPYDMSAALRGVLKRAEGPPESKGNMACFLPAQGGNGASTAAIHFAACVGVELPAEAKPGGGISPVLLIDLDFHSDSTAFWLNKRPGYTLIDALENSAPAPGYWRKITTTWNGVDLLSPPPPDHYVSKEALESLAGVVAAARQVYPWVVVDLPPALFASSRGLLPASDFVFLVCTPEARSLYLAKRRIIELKSLGLADESLRVTLNRAGAKRAIEASTAEKSIGAPVHYSIDNDYAEISSAYSDRRLASPSSGPGRQFRSMARVTLGLDEPGVEKAQGWRRFVGLG